MNPFRYVRKRPFATLFFLLVAVGVADFVLHKTRAKSYPPGQTPKVYVYLDQAEGRALKVEEFVLHRIEGLLHKHHEEEGPHEAHRIMVTSPRIQDVNRTQQYVCQLHSQQHIEVCALENGYLEAILVKEGQQVKKGDPMFKVIPTLYQAKLEAEMAEAQLAQLEFNYTKKLAEQKVVSQNELALLQAKLQKAQAKAKQAGAELNFATVRAPFDGIMDRLHDQLGSLVKEGDVLTTLSDNSKMWAYFNVPEADYLEYMAHKDDDQDHHIELLLANGRKFDQQGEIGAIEAKFNPETGNIPFRADFPNPKGLLRHGQTGNVLIHRVLRGATVIPQRATFETLDKRYVYVVGTDRVAHQREIAVQHELEDLFVIEKGLGPDDKIVLEGIRQIHEGEKVEYVYIAPDQVDKQLKNLAE